MQQIRLDGRTDAHTHTHTRVFVRFVSCVRFYCATLVDRMHMHVATSQERHTHPYRAPFFGPLLEHFPMERHTDCHGFCVCGFVRFAFLRTLTHNTRPLVDRSANGSLVVHTLCQMYISLHSDTTAVCAMRYHLDTSGVCQEIAKIPTVNDGPRARTNPSCSTREPTTQETATMSEPVDE